MAEGWFLELNKKFKNYQKKIQRLRFKEKKI